MTMKTKIAAAVTATALGAGSLIGLAAPASAATPGSRCYVQIRTAIGVTLTALPGTVDPDGHHCRLSEQAIERLPAALGPTVGGAVASALYAAGSVVFCGDNLNVLAVTLVVYCRN